MEHGKHEMHDLGEMRNMGGEMPVMEGKSKKEKHYPSVSISSKQMPELKGKKYGDSVEMHIKGEIGGMHEDYDNKEEADYEIKMMECGMMKGNKVDEDEYKNMTDEDKDKADEKEVLEKEE